MPDENGSMHRALGRSVWIGMMVAFALAPLSGTDASNASLGVSDPTLNSPTARSRRAAQALAGDGGAAWTLALYFANSDSKASNLWRRVAVENRHPEALVSVGYTMSDSTDYCTMVRGIYFIQLGAQLLESAEDRAKWRDVASRQRKRMDPRKAHDCSERSEALYTK